MSEQSIIRPSSNRLLSLDMFRGMTIMAMILVNNPGSWEHVYPPLRHADWHGCTMTDLIFPFFLFIVGVAMSFSFSKRKASTDALRPLALQIIKRTLILFGLGLFLSWFPYFEISEGRIPGVLQRIALCYFFASWIVLFFKPKMQWLVAFLLLAIYWIGMKFISVPGYGAGILEPVGNLCWYIDNQLLAGHTWKYAPASGFDPEGVFSTLTAIVTTLFGVFTGDWLRTKREHDSKLVGIFVSGNFALLAGYILTIWMPWNKNLWTASYFSYTAGLALLFLGMCYWLVDVKGYQKIAKPFVIFGSNAIFVYFCSSAVAKLLYIFKVSNESGEMTVSSWLYQNLFQSWAGDINGSLFYAITYVLIWLGASYLLYRKRIFIKV